MAYRPLVTEPTGANKQYRPLAQAQPPVQQNLPQRQGDAISQSLGYGLGTTLAPKKEKGIIGRAIDDIKIIQESPDVSAVDVIKGMPSEAARQAKSLVTTLVPALSKFVKTTGSIIGEGMAYAFDKRVREQYLAGNLDVLPTISETTQKDLTKYTVAAGIEAAVFRSFPNSLKQQVLIRGGQGALQGLGFAIAEGMANDLTPEEIAENAKMYGASGTVLTIAAPHLIPLLKKELTVGGPFKQALKSLDGPASSNVRMTGENPRFERAMRNKGYVPTQETLAQKVSHLADNSLEKSKVGMREESLAAIRQNTDIVKNKEVRLREVDGKVVIEDGRHSLQVATETGVEPRYVDVTAKYTGTPSQRVQELIAGSGKEKVSTLQRRIAGVADNISPEDARSLGLTTYKTSNQRENITKALKYFEGRDDEAVAVLNGTKEMPKELNVETNALLVAMMQKADDIADPVLAAKVSSTLHARTLAATQAGKEISVLQRIDPDGAVSNMADIVEARVLALERKTKSTKEAVVKEVKKEAKKVMSSARMKIEEATKLLDDLTC